MHGMIGSGCHISSLLEFHGMLANPPTDCHKLRFQLHNSGFTIHDKCYQSSHCTRTDDGSDDAGNNANNNTNNVRNDARNDARGSAGTKMWSAEKMRRVHCSPIRAITWLCWPNADCAEHEVLVSLASILVP